MNKSVQGFVMIIVIMALSITKASSQSDNPDLLAKGTLSEQMKYLEEHTRIYENYRAIREDMFQKIKNNSVDSLSSSKIKILGLMNFTASLNNRIDSLNTSLNTTKKELNETLMTKNSISVVGLKLNKTTYNSIMWIIVAGLGALLVIGFLSFKRNLSINHNMKKELNDLKQEFEEYRNKTRIEREKMSMAHFKEMQKLKGQ